MSEQRYMVQSGDGAHAKYFMACAGTRPIMTSHVKQAHTWWDKQEAEHYAAAIASRNGEKCRVAKYGY